jgi:hypothetical protein
MLYIYYIADMLEDERVTKKFGIVDDTNALAVGKSERETAGKLSQDYPVAQQWEKQHASAWAPTKFRLVHLRPPPEIARRVPELDT